jgi:hypothetical protein
MWEAIAIALIPRLASPHHNDPVADLIGTTLVEKALGTRHTFQQSGTMNHVTGRTPRWNLLFQLLRPLGSTAAGH